MKRPTIKWKLFSSDLKSAAVALNSNRVKGANKLIEKATGITHRTMDHIRAGRCNLDTARFLAACKWMRKNPMKYLVNKENKNE